MKTLKITAISILSSLFVFANANAGELSVTGSVKATYAINSVDGSETDNNTGKGMGLANEFTLNASGELDNGYTWSFNQDIDDATVQDDASLTIGMGGLGSVKWNISDGGIQKNFSSSQSTYGTPVDNGTSGTFPLLKPLSLRSGKPRIYWSASMVSVYGVPGAVSLNGKPDLAEAGCISISIQSAGQENTAYKAWSTYCQLPKRLAVTSLFQTVTTFMKKYRNYTAIGLAA